MTAPFRPESEDDRRRRLAREGMAGLMAQRPDMARVNTDPNREPGLLRPSLPLELVAGTINYARENPGRFALDFTPVGDALSVRDAGRDLQRGDYGSAAINALAAVPIVGAVAPAVKGAVKGTSTAARAARPARTAAVASRPVRSIQDLAGLTDPTATGRQLVVNLEDLRAVPNVPQVPITTRPIPARGVPADVTQAVKRNRRSFEDAVERGMDNGGLEWYNLDPLRQDYIAELGEEAGNREFARFTQHLAATSPRATVAQNTRRAAAFSLINRHGLEVPDDQSLLTNVGPTLGHLAHRTAHIPSVRDIERYGTMSANDEVLLRRPKTSSFGENLRGNYEPVTIDAHNLSAWGLPSSRADAAYDVLERQQKEIAAKLGIRPAQVQSSAWIGAADETKVADPRPFMQVFQDVLGESAKRQGLPPDIVYQRFLRGTGALGLAGLLGGTAAQETPDI